MTDLHERVEAQAALVEDWVVEQSNVIPMRNCSASHPSLALVQTSIPPGFRGHLGIQNSYKRFLLDNDRRRVTVDARRVSFIPKAFPTIPHPPEVSPVRLSYSSVLIVCHIILARTRD